MEKTSDIINSIVIIECFSVRFYFFSFHLQNVEKSRERKLFALGERGVKTRTTITAMTLARKENPICLKDKLTYTHTHIDHDFIHFLAN
jgi:hypothetical protein